VVGLIDIHREHAMSVSHTTASSFSFHNLSCVVVLFGMGHPPPEHPTHLRHMLAISTSHVGQEKRQIDANGVSKPRSVFEYIHAQIDPGGEKAEDMQYDLVQRMYLD